MQRLVALISDFGTTDSYAGQMEAAVLAQAPDARVVSITHGIPPQDIALGAVVVAASLERLPLGAILVAVVDPGVGGRRRGLIVRAASRWLVGPDNGLLMGPPAIEGVWHLDRPDYWNPDPHPTFHGRDVFAPVAGHLARYVRPDAMASPIGDALPAPETVAQARDGMAEGRIVQVDHFGNLITNIPSAAVEAIAHGVVELCGMRIDGVQPTYGSGSDPVAVVSSLGLLEIAVPGSSAQSTLGAKRGDPVRLRPA
ncbi:MAG: SAM-dependent chlorinase/fluorinase [Chloroflexi bacterium]|nr:SAM-dependent chlorinase/fluorinase [Chloroflexota bacterium]